MEIDDDEVDTLLNFVYYSLDSPACFSGFDRVYKEAHRRDGRITKYHVREFLRTQRTYTLYHPAVRRFKRRRTVPAGLNTDWQADLTFLERLAPHNDGHIAMLVCVDVLSRKIYVEPVKTKTGRDVQHAFDAIFERAGTKPWRIYTDRGGEFESHAMKRYFSRKDILKYAAQTNKVQKASVAERANRTVKERLYKYCSQNNTLRWIDVIQRIVDAINHSVCRMTGMRPVDVTEANAPPLVKRLYPVDRNVKRPKFEVGDCVRVQHRKQPFSKGLTHYTDKVFTVTNVLAFKSPPLYELEDFFHLPLQGYFYERELVKVANPYLENSFRIERILDEREINGRREVLVKWLDHEPAYNTWEPAETVGEIAVPIVYQRE